MSRPAHPFDGRSGLFTDLYELTMARAYLAEGMEDTAVFELFFRELPPTRNYVLACGLGDVLEYLEGFRFRDDEIEYLHSYREFPADFLKRLADLRFTGDVHAVPEGTVVFAHEPVLQVIAPITEAQLVETYLLNQVHLQSVAASKASRLVQAARGRPLVDFGSRRAHGADAALKVARASYAAGFAGTSNVLAARRYGIPAHGTLAHSYIQAHDDEEQALRRFTSLYPNSTLLIDTYDTIEGVRRVIALVRELGPNHRPHAVRLDSGDLSNLSRQCRRLLDQAGLKDVQILVSSELDEDAIDRLLCGGAPVDGFGVGTSLAVSRDTPYLDIVYKLVEYAGRPRLKLSSHKILLPGRKQIFRRMRDGRFESDVIGRHDESLDGEPLLVPVMKAGRCLPEMQPDLETIRERARRQVESLPPEIRSLDKRSPGYPVRISENLASDRDRLQASLNHPSTEGPVGSIPEERVD
ncbi:MAG: nicotinate phosphoribosyltransferase [Acidobacteriota bacterium]